ncbi:FMN-dependent NADH-azoreductase [Paraburkholderia sp. BCC1886]|uniref:FMN-dependent NADH-azoreductase n=1 Tax=Paraburkholderia sp. BCC1886 TaxID=2562670 RepID=UPI001642F89A|nr:NAD(P)H-dependent oxidoreductase [Paraburkholderia sp. BCC1886]
MSHLLYIEASPGELNSHSSQVASRYIESRTQSGPVTSVQRLNLWEETLPAFDRKVIEAKFAVLRKKEFSTDQLEAWTKVKRFADEFCSADEYVLSVPMWNFSVPYVLKHYIDVITLADVNWIWSPESGYKGLLKDKSATLIYSSASDYPLGPDYHPHDFQKPYLRKWLNFIGVEDIQEINVAPTLAAPDTLASVKANATEVAQQLGQSAAALHGQHAS